MEGRVEELQENRDHYWNRLVQEITYSYSPCLYRVQSTPSIDLLFLVRFRLCKRCPCHVPKSPLVYSRPQHHHTSPMKQPFSYRPQFQLGLLMGDPFALSTISLGIIGWIIALGGSISFNDQFKNFGWWGLAFEFFVILCVFLVVATDSVEPYRQVLLAFLALATMYVTNSVNNVVYSGTSASSASGAGHILLSIINFLWMIYFGTTHEAGIHAWVDSFAADKGHSYNNDQFAMRRSNPFSLHEQRQSLGVPGRPVSAYSAGMGGATNNYNGLQLGGFENSSNTEPHQQSPAFNQQATPQPPQDSLFVATEYPYRARAVYAYQANPEDANEISFDKGEILDVSDISGRWWQARRDNGEIGICPSNYVELLA